MTTPNGSNPSGANDDRAQPPLPSNSKPGSWTSVPRGVLIGGAAAVLVVVVVVVIALSGGGDSDTDNAGVDSGNGSGADTTTSETKFEPNIVNAKFGGWRDKKTNEIVTPPQSIKITDSLDLTDKVVATGYGADEQSLPKRARNAATDASFPANQPITLFANADGALSLLWSCETLYNEPAAANCQDNYNLVVDISGSAPRVVSASANNPDPAPEAKTALGVDVQHMAVINREELPESAFGTDKGTGADTVLVLGAVQPRESSTKVYFVVPDSLKLYVGELESAR